MLATFVLGVLIFVDDYLNCLTVGSVMQPITDRNKVSRAIPEKTNHMSDKK